MGVRPALPLPWGLIWGILLWVWFSFLFKKKDVLVVLMASCSPFGSVCSVKLDHDPCGSLTCHKAFLRT